jgi:membrane associated rhomboid family serine protease
VTLIPLLFVFFKAQLPAAVLLGFWFLVQTLSGLESLGADSGTGGVAWWAHIGGFVLGMVLAKLFSPSEPRRVVVRY